MSKKFYETKIVGVGGDVPKFLSAVKMLVLFDDSMVLPELRNFSVLHSGNKLDGVIKPGDVLKVADSEFKILKVGGEVHSNIRTLGHVIIKFDGGKGDLMEGSIHVEDKPIPAVQIGDSISIREAGADALKGKKAAIVGADNEVATALKKILVDNGATITSESDSEIVITVK
ncbi:MAG: PTS glucitol/sorbitol transporter subunit IIA [Selenomonadaceae bacterium]|nr:PTS glucitol/sorbitol transporter subunit IIA [Selenomonadaceae bacterium]